MSQAVLPRLDPRANVEPDVLAFLDALARAGFAGDIQTDYATRLTAATDNSIYQMLPAAVVFPKRAAVDVTIDVYPDMQHVFHFLAGVAPEADDAIRKLARWVRPKLELG